MKFMDEKLNGKHLNFIASGNGSPVVLIHGWGASMYDWASLIPDLAMAGYEAFAVDLLGHGDSAKPQDSEYYCRDGIYETFEAWLESLEADPPYILVGHSLGGYLSLLYGLHHQENLRAMVLINPLYSPEQISPIFRWAYQRPDLGVKALELATPQMIDRILGWDPTSKEHFPPHVRLQIAIDYKRASPHILYIPRTISDLTPEIDELNIPSLVIWGDKDRSLNPSSFPELVSTLPQASGKNIRGCGHQPHLGQPETINHLVIDFISNASQ
jgi:pimeloyl-ACP methyl ester carboxylesterase